MNELIRFLQRDIPCVERPFEDLALRLGIPEEKVIETIKQWVKAGIIRRLGAVLSHTRVGKNINVMAVWKCPQEKLDQAGKKMASFKEVSHCYERETFEGWKFNLFTMIHANDIDHCQQLVKSMAALTGLSEYELLFTQKEFKKVSWEIE